MSDGSGPLAQLAEQQTLNLRVLGSSPRRLTIRCPSWGNTEAVYRDPTKELSGLEEGDC